MFVHSDDEGWARHHAYSPKRAIDWNLKHSGSAGKRRLFYCFFGLTNRVHISFDNGKLIAELGDGAECHHEGSVFMPICKHS